MEVVDAGAEAAPNAPGVGAGAPNIEPPEAAAGLLCWPPNIEEVVAAAGAAAGARPPNAGALAGVIVVWPAML